MLLFRFLEVSEESPHRFVVDLIVVLEVLF